MSKYDVSVVGLGYVGLTLATVLADVGFKVLGIEKRKEVVDLTNEGKAHFSEKGLNAVLDDVVKRGNFVSSNDFDDQSVADVYIITVGTPLDKQGNARLDMIQTATRQVAKNMRDGALVILRSTVKIGTTREVVAPILEESGKKFELAMCPERTLEGSALKELRNLPQIVGADSVETRKRAGGLFSKLTNTIVEVSTYETAEVIKLVDNTYRDVTFAFANEVARICDAFKINSMEVIKSGKLGYTRTNVPLPGLVGGPCLEKDPHILAQSCLEKELALDITTSARKVNERQPLETVDFIGSIAASKNFSSNMKIALLGMAFKGVPETDDLRGAMSLKVLDALRDKFQDADIWVYDPVVKPEVMAEEIGGVTPTGSITEALENASIAIIANNHPVFSDVPPKQMGKYMAKDGVIYDYWNHFSVYDSSDLSNYFAVGNLTSLNS